MGTRNFWKASDCPPPFTPGRGHRDIFGSDTPPPPDYTPMQAASDKAAELGLQLGQEQLAESRRQYDINRGVSSRVADSQIGLMDQAKAQGDDYYNYMKQMQRPVENRLNELGMRDTAAQDAAARAGIQGQYDQMARGMGLGQQYVSSRYAGMDAQARQDQMNQADQYALMNQQGIAGQQALMGQYGANTAADVAAQQNIMARYGSNAAAENANRQGMLDYATANSAQNRADIGLITGGNQGVYDARQGDIEWGVGNAAADARLGQSQALQQALRQGQRLGYSPAKMAALAQQMAGSNASQVASGMNSARTAGIDQARGLMGQGYDMRNADFNTQYGALQNNYNQSQGTNNQLLAGDINSRQMQLDQGDRSLQGLQNNYALQQQLGQQNVQGLQQQYGMNLDRGNLGIQGAMSNRQMGMEQAQTGIQGAMNNRNLQMQDTANSWGKMLDVAGLYRGLPGASQGAYGLSTNAGNAAMGNTMAPGSALLGGMAQGAGIQQTGVGQQMTGLSGILNAQNSYNQMVGQANASSSAGLGQLAGTALTAYAMFGSDRRLKQDVEQVGIDGTTGLPLYEFRYINGDGRRFRGVMSDDVRKYMPEAVYSIGGYDAVRYDMIGVQMVEV